MGPGGFVRGFKKRRYTYQCTGYDRAEGRPSTGPKPPRRLPRRSFHGDWAPVSRGRESLLSTPRRFGVGVDRSEWGGSSTYVCRLYRQMCRKPTPFYSKEYHGDQKLNCCCKSCHRHTSGYQTQVAANMGVAVTHDVRSTEQKLMFNWRRTSLPPKGRRPL